MQTCVRRGEGGAAGSSGQPLLNYLPGELGNLESNEHSRESRPPTPAPIYSKRTRRY